MAHTAYLAIGLSLTCSGLAADEPLQVHMELCW